MIDPGALNQRLGLEAPVETPDGAGGVTFGYTLADTLWASLTPLSARAAVVADSAGGAVTHRIVLRSGPQITTRHRLRKGARIFRIVSVRELDSSDRFLVVMAEERAE